MAAGVGVHGVGKTPELFAGVGFSETHPGPTNAHAIAEIDALIGALDGGLVFANLIETDQLYGHRKDAHGFHGALRELDAAVGRVARAAGGGGSAGDHRRPRLRPAAPHSDHTREHAPLLARFAGHAGAATTGRSPTSAHRCSTG